MLFGASVAFAWLELTAILFEMALVLLASVAGGVLYHLAYYEVFPPVDGFLGIGVVGAVLHLFIAKLQGLYDAPVLAGLDRRWSRLLCGWLLVVLLLTLFIFLLKAGAGVSRGSMLSFGLVGAAALILGRATLQRPLQRALDRGTLATRPAIVVGTLEELSRLRATDLLRKYGLTEVARITLPDPLDQRAPDSGDPQFIDGAIRLVRESRAEEIVLAISWDQQDRIGAVCEQLRASPLPVHLLPDHTTERFLSMPIVATGPLPTVEMQRAPLSAFERICKRTFDLVVASGLLVVLLPVLIAAAIMIRLDSSGPILFRQRRNGFDGKSFSILKFRTMHVIEDGNVVEQARPGDPRITRIGKHMRRHSIDELPQLVNVVRGEMSLVGPRPHAIAHDDKFSKLIASYAFRQHVKPGITGLAQVNGLRGPTPRVEDMRLRVERDLAYIKGWSFMLDLRIILQTFGELLWGRAH
ncbi:exopolysaccharide biosynthesis polyprenyl glycosylphosphotransferase [Bradyrhizobium guangzhouense]|uniref:exopolysaccharide biosynthesis polyprenyl glycosylphosphotransferase n=1 Tax=Bradyrhizobium guangzhouense TaxID=1325095 RepID=UPI001FE088E5|nr:exopolysaccharide biosynthesis polyprenyl glycosylphosphotransferase [Bradyrhizobium guangzhouense]